VYPWVLANPMSIQMDDAGQVWHAGRCVDLLGLGQGKIVVATDTGGVWSVDGAYNATPLSDTWASPDMECLAFGPLGPNHLMAGARGALFETDPAPPFPRPGGPGPATDLSLPTPKFVWRQVTLPPPVTTVHRIAVTDGPPRVVIATDAGIWWASSDPNGHYAWTAAIGVPQDDFFGLAPTSKGVIAGVGSPTNGAQGIYNGTWQGSNLDFAPARYPHVIRLGGSGIQPGKMRQVSVATCKASPDRAYAIAADRDANGQILYILASDNGGELWSLCDTKFDAAYHGSDEFITFFGNWNNGGRHKTISVDPGDPNVVAFSWLRAAISSNGGATWIPLGGAWTPDDGLWHYYPQAAGLHEDTHAVCFDDSTPHKIYVLSDGGVAESADWREFQRPFLSYANRKLANLQFLSTQTQLRRRELDGPIWGTLGCDVALDLVGGGLQDNANVWCHIDLNAPPTPWHRVDRGDGGWVAFLDVSGGQRLVQMVSRTNDQDDANPARHYSWDPPPHSQFSNQGTIPLLTRLGNVDTTGIRSVIAEPIPTPRFKGLHAAEQILFAVGAGNVRASSILDPVPVDLGGKDLAKRILFGLFGTAANYELFWAEIASLPADTAEITSVGPDSRGDYTFVGTGDGRIFSVDTQQRTVLEVAVETPSTGRGAVRRIVSDGERGAFATMDDGSSGGCLLKLVTLQGWRIAPGAPRPFAERFYGLDINRGPADVGLALATDTWVWVSPGRDNPGDTWLPWNTNLPATPHCADLRFGSVQGNPALLLSTYGRGVWVAGLGDRPLTG
jgi:hypothetical protein